VAAAAALKAARDRLARATRQVSACGAITLDAPETSLLRAVHATPGQTVAAGAPLFDLVRIDTVWIRVPLFGAEANDVDPRAPARIVPLGADAATPGAVATPVTAPPSADAATASVDLYYSLSNGAATASIASTAAHTATVTHGATAANGASAAMRLRPGQRVGVRVSLQGDAPRLVAPAAALLHDAFGGTWVYEMRDAHTFVRRRVSVADLVNGLAVLDQGPPAGTRVVTAGAAELFGTEFGVGK
jgi:multidrug efflux pump subunit AcrA (membrane-fusion protein)